MAWFAMALLRSDKRLRGVTTNNKAVSDLLCSTCKVWQTEGWADTKYYGVFPFTEDDSDPNHDTLEFMKLYSALSSAKIDRLFLEASRFSFVIGPTVNSWQNVCYKAAAYNVQKPIELFLEAKKVLQVVGNADDLKSTYPRETLRWHVANCFSVFELPQFQDKTLERVGLSDMQTWKQKGAGTSKFHGAPGVPALARSWVDLVASGREIRVWIVSSDPSQLQGVQSHLGTLNSAMKGVPKWTAWSVDKEYHERDGHVLCVIPLRGSPN